MNDIFCKNLKEARKTKGFTQREIAKFLNVVESCYANWEQGRTEPNTSDLQKLCLILDVPSDYLLGLESEDGTKVRIHNSFNNNSGSIGNIGNIQIGNNNKNH